MLLAHPHSLLARQRHRCWRLAWLGRTWQAPGGVAEGGVAEGGVAEGGIAEGGVAGRGGTTEARGAGEPWSGGRRPGRWSPTAVPATVAASTERRARTGRMAAQNGPAVVTVVESVGDDAPVVRTGLIG